MEDQNLLVIGWPLDSPILEGRCVWIIHAEELCIFLTHAKQLFAGFWWSTTFLLSLKGEIFESLLLNHVISAILLGWKPFFRDVLPNPGRCNTEVCGRFIRSKILSHA